MHQAQRKQRWNSDGYHLYFAEWIARDVFHSNKENRPLSVHGGRHRNNKNMLLPSNGVVFTVFMRGVHMIALPVLVFMTFFFVILECV